MKKTTNILVAVFLFSEAGLAQPAEFDLSIDGYIQIFIDTGNGEHSQYTDNWEQNDFDSDTGKPYPVKSDPFECFHVSTPFSV